MEAHIEAVGVERREFALNGEKARRMGCNLNAVYRFTGG
jgi:hypothetical protein